MTRALITLLIAATTVVFAQDGAVVWQPPKLEGIPDNLPQATVSKEMITKLRVDKVQVILEETPLKDIQKKLGGIIGSSGHAGDFVEWICFHDSEAKGRRVLWLESNEMGGHLVDGFALQRVAEKATLDRRCRAGASEIELPAGITLGLTESEVLRRLGPPTAKYGNILYFEHEHQETIRAEPYTSSYSVYVEIRSGVVGMIQAWKTTSN